MRFAFLVIHSCPSGLPGSGNVGGMNVYVRELAAYLGRQGHLIDIYTRAHDGHSLVTETIARNVRLIHLADGNGSDVDDKLAIYERLPVLVSNLEQFYRTHNLHYDIIFSHYWPSREAEFVNTAILRFGCGMCQRAVAFALSRDTRTELTPYP